MRNEILRTLEPPGNGTVCTPRKRDERLQAATEHESKKTLCSDADCRDLVTCVLKPVAYRCSVNASYMNVSSSIAVQNGAENGI
jgi:hypothetical protein